MRPITLYGLKTCDSCRKAMSALQAAGFAPRLIDLRADVDLADLAPAWIASVGRDALINRRSTTWKGLSDAERVQADDDAGALALVQAHPAVIKRPVVVSGDRVWAGWTSAVLSALAA